VDTTITTIKYDDFAKLDLRVATVLECKNHANADKLLILKLDLGTEQRQICTALRGYFEPESLVGTQMIIVANLEPRMMRGEVSQGMLLAVTDSATGKFVIVAPSAPATAGSKAS
jgi:methionine--tRNA ligase beta chain